MSAPARTQHIYEHQSPPHHHGHRTPNEIPTKYQPSNIKYPILTTSAHLNALPLIFTHTQNKLHMYPPLILTQVPSYHTSPLPINPLALSPRVTQNTPALHLPRRHGGRYGCEGAWASSLLLFPSFCAVGDWYKRGGRVIL